MADTPPEVELLTASELTDEDVGRVLYLSADEAVELRGVDRSNSRSLTLTVKKPDGTEHDVHVYHRAVLSLEPNDYADLL